MAFTVHGILKQLRGPGLVTSAAVSVPAGAPKGQTVSCTALMDAADIADVTLIITSCGIQWSEDGGATWNILVGGPWRGGITDHHGGGPFPPSFSVQMDDGTSSLLAGKQVRLFANLPRALNFGMDVTVT